MHANLTTTQSDFLYNLYLMMRAAPLTMHGRYRTFEAAAVDICPWHIDAISLNALAHLVNKETAKGLKRGHRMARKQRGEQLFSDFTRVMSQDVMLRFFFENDCVTLITGDENAQGGIDHWSEQIPVPKEHMKGGSYSPYATKADIAWAKDVLRRYEDDHQSPSPDRLEEAASTSAPSTA
jgi:hypothetical protein